MLKGEFPILEYDGMSESVIDPYKIIAKMDIPEQVVICFFNDVVEDLRRNNKVKLITNLKSEIGLHPIYQLDYMGRRIGLFHPGIGAPLAAGMMEEVIALGAKKFIACGGAGVLDRNITVGHVVVPCSAVRDEGTSYHYIPPDREIETSREGIEAIESVLKKHRCKYIIGKTWTTDALYRETKDKVALRKAEGCLTVEMECAAFCAVARFRNAIFAQILYGGDDVSCEEWDSRQWMDRKEIREKILWFAAEACTLL